jgi:hypothetical protein
MPTSPKYWFFCIGCEKIVKLAAPYHCIICGAIETVRVQNHVIEDLEYEIKLLKQIKLSNQKQKQLLPFGKEKE